MKEWWAEHGRSETLRETNPRFATSFMLDYVDHNDDYSCEFDQWIKIELYQRKSQMPDLSRHIKQGEMVFTLRSIYRVPVRRESAELDRGGTMAARLQPVPEEVDTIGALELRITANLVGIHTGVDNQICPYIQMMRYVGLDAKNKPFFEPIYRSAVVRNAERPDFGDVHLSPHHVANIVKESSYIKFEVYDMEARGDPRCIGAMETTLAHMLEDSGASRSAAKREGRDWRGCTYVLGPQDTRQGEMAKPVAKAPRGKPSIRIAAIFDDSKQQEAQAEAMKRSPKGAMTRRVKLKPPKDGVNKSGRKKLPPADALAGQGTSSFGTFGEDERFLANLMLQQEFRETDLREVVDESLQYIDERRAHWLASHAATVDEDGLEKEDGRGMGAVLDWGDGGNPAQGSAKKRTGRLHRKHADRAAHGTLRGSSNSGHNLMPRKHSHIRADHRGDEANAGRHSTIVSTDSAVHDPSLKKRPKRQPSSQMARAPGSKRAVESSKSMPEMGDGEYAIDDHAASHGVLPRLNITQRWDTFDINASDEMVIHQHRLRRKEKQAARAKRRGHDTSTYEPDTTSCLEGLLSAETRCVQTLPTTTAVQDAAAAAPRPALALSSWLWLRAEIRRSDPKNSMMPSKDEMRRRSLQRRAHERLHGRKVRAEEAGEADLG